MTPEPKSLSLTRFTTLSMRSRTFGRTSRSSQVPAAFHALPAESFLFKFSSDGNLTCCTLESGNFVSRCLYQVKGSSSSSSDDSTFSGFFLGGLGFAGGSFFFESFGGQHTRLWKRQSSRWQRAPQEATFLQRWQAFRTASVSPQFAHFTCLIGVAAAFL